MKGNYISHFFNKEPNDIEESDITSFFSSPQEETSSLEFKSGEAEINDIFKEITAFLNTEGGLLIVGAPKENRQQKGTKTVRICQGQITYSLFQSKEWIFQKIYSNITPSPTNIFIKEIITTSGNLFLIEVPQSLTPPHQSNADGRYYIRIDTEAKPAPHGLIQSLFEKRKKPLLLSKLDRSAINIGIDSLNIRIQNESNTPADKVSFMIEIYNIVEVVDDTDFKSIYDEEFGPKHSTTKSTDQILVRVISFGLSFELLHRNRPYLVMVSYWSKDTDYDSTFYMINPLDNTIISKNWLDEDSNLIETIKSLIP